MPGNGDRTSVGSIELRVSGRASVATAQIEALLATLEAVTEPAERAETLVEIARRTRDDLGDSGQAIDALLEAWRVDPTQEEILDVLEPLVTAERRWEEILETTRTRGRTHHPWRDASQAQVRTLRCLAVSRTPSPG